MVVGLLLFALLLVASAPAWYGGDPDERHVNVATELWAPAWAEQSSTAPSMSARTPEHPPSRVPFAAPPVADQAGRQLPLWHAWHDPAAGFTPQDAARRPVGSRSPPSA
ncbi:hypothetical protein Sme01_64950 [Sphaerisporangium melleum]|uniref:Uncharacterized protein n=1 Tax=Sphaerisporangium melleum TaxID=321316 RepID=A0A917RE45_9ACTN|nr:hypothetical protein [Sphaerisporangium melleum]GGL03802.1 hypothetical protein GCM10007964_52360 [Sphaerisporangium melleum]GII74019.1 hypothetical protein Sme01_64950 [Sphaerisporangium melleum]